MKTFTQAIAVVLFSLPLLAHAAGKTASASMQVTFELKESCTVQTTADASANKASTTAPAVACQLSTPYQMTRSDAAANNAGTAGNTAIRQQDTTGAWTITF